MPATKTHYIPAGYHTATPYLIISKGNAAKALDWYREVFGANEVMRFPTPDGKIGHAETKIGDSFIMLADEYPEMGYVGPETLGGSPGLIMIYVENVDAVYKKALDRGAKVSIDSAWLTISRSERPWASRSWTWLIGSSRISSCTRVVAFQGILLGLLLLVVLTTT